MCFILCVDLQYINAAACTNTIDNAKQMVMNVFKAITIWINQ